MRGQSCVVFNATGDTDLDHFSARRTGTKRVGLPDVDTFAVLPWDWKVARVFCTLFRGREEVIDPGAYLTSDCRGNVGLHPLQARRMGAVHLHGHRVGPQGVPGHPAVTTPDDWPLALTQARDGGTVAEWLSSEGIGVVHLGIYDASGTLREKRSWRRPLRTRSSGAGRSSTPSTPGIRATAPSPITEPFTSPPPSM